MRVCVCVCACGNQVRSSGGSRKGPLDKPPGAGHGPGWQLVLMTIHNLARVPTVAWIQASSAQVPTALALVAAPTCRPSGREGSRMGESRKWAWLCHRLVLVLWFPLGLGCLTGQYQVSGVRSTHSLKS